MLNVKYLPNYLNTAPCPIFHDTDVTTCLLNLWTRKENCATSMWLKQQDGEVTGAIIISTHGHDFDRVVTFQGVTGKHSLRFYDDADLVRANVHLRGFIEQSLAHDRVNIKRAARLAAIVDPQFDLTALGA